MSLAPRVLLVSLAPLALGATAASLAAQTATGNLRGYVNGPSGVAVGDVQVAARALDNNQQRGTLTNASGFYYIGGLRPGRYEVSARRVGFTPVTRTVDLQIGQTLDLTLPIVEAAVQLSAVQVTTSATGTTTRTSEVGSNVSRDQIRDLPNFERNVLDLAKLVPGITPSAVNSTDKTFAAGGQPPEAINVFVDGATYKNDVLRGGVAGQDASKGNPFPQGAIQEFRVLTQNYKAEYQKASSAIIVATTRSGTNEAEAEVFANGVGRGYAAKDAFSSLKNLGRPDYKRLQAGGSYGGPLVRDRLFFFGTYELNFRDEPAYVTLGTDAARAPAGLNPAQYTGQFVQEFREHLGLAKLTWNKSDKSTVDASVNIRHDADFRGFGGQTAYSGAENLNVQVYTGVANWKYAGDRWLNEAQLNAQTMTWNPTPLNGNTIGQNYFGIIRIGGKDTEQDFKQNRLSLRDDVTRGGVQLGGDHVFKGGASVDFLGYTGTKYTLTNPVFNYRSDENFSRPFEA
ncbi:MAG: carboxypeptidase regulatory-like domain-containing protein, partial [Gemmatirosa sp.]|nr:carboxypeptidase regulatory-like domain-containing protein [Gemmatirosa sp.]